MKYLIILALCILSTAKLSFQGAFGRKSVRTSADALVFNIFIFIISALIFLPKVFGCSPAVWIYASSAAIFTIGYQISYTKALSSGNVSLTVLITNFSMVLSVLVSYVVFKDPISPLRLVGIILTITAFIVCCQVADSGKGDKKWLITSVFAMVFVTGGNIASKAFGESAYAGENLAFTSCLYISAAVFGMVIYPIIKGKTKLSFEINFNMIKYALLTGLSLTIYQGINMYALATVDATFLFPALTGGTIVLSTLSSIILFKDNFTKRQIAGLVLGIIALVIMNF